MTKLEIFIYVVAYFSFLTVLGLALWVVAYYLYFVHHPDNKEIQKHLRK